MIPKVAVVDINAVYQAANANSDAVKRLFSFKRSIAMRSKTTRSDRRDERASC